MYESYCIFGENSPRPIQGAALGSSLRLNYLGLRYTNRVSALARFTVRGFSGSWSMAKHVNRRRKNIGSIPSRPLMSLNDGFIRYLREGQL